MPVREITIEFVYSRQQKWEIMGGSDSGTFFDTVATVDVVDVLAARNNTELAETRTVLFEDS